MIGELKGKADELLDRIEQLERLITVAGRCVIAGTRLALSSHASANAPASVVFE